MPHTSPSFAQLLHGAERQHAPGHDACAVGERVGFFHAVRCEHDAAVRGEGGEGAPHSAFGGGVETAGGFVEEEDGGIADEGDGEGEFALGAAGKLRGGELAFWGFEGGDGEVLGGFVEGMLLEDVPEFFKA